MSTAIVTAEKLWKDQTSWGKLQSAVQSVLGPQGIDTRRFLTLAQRSVAHNPRLMQCTALSVAASIVEAAIWGLEIGPHAGQAFLVPFNNKVEINGKWTKRMECQTQIGYKGFETAAWREARILIPSVCVYKKDKFRYVMGSNPFIEHEPYLAANGDDRGGLVAVYARAVFPDGRELLCVHDIQEIERRRKLSKAADGDAWSRFYDSMARKGPIRQLGSTAIPYSFAPRLQEMASRDEQREYGVDSMALPEAIEVAQDAIEEKSQVAPGFGEESGKIPPHSPQEASSAPIPENPDSPAASSPIITDWFPKAPGDECTLGPIYIEEKETVKRKGYEVGVIHTADFELSTFDLKLYRAVPRGRTVLAAWIDSTKGKYTNHTLQAIKAMPEGK